MKKDFFDFLLEKRWGMINPKMESFIKGDENVFHAKSILISNYWLALFILLLYVSVLMFFIRRKATTLLTKGSPGTYKKDYKKFEKYRRYFIKTKDSKKYLARFNKKDNLFIGDIKKTYFDNEIFVGDLLSFYCPHTVLEHEHKDYYNDWFTGNKKKKLKDISEDELKELYFRAMINEKNLYEHTNIVIDNFFYPLDAEIETRCRLLIYDIKNSVIVLSAKQFIFTMFADELKPLAEGQCMQIELDKIKFN